MLFNNISLDLVSIQFTDYNITTSKFLNFNNHAHVFFVNVTDIFLYQTLWISNYGQEKNESISISLGPKEISFMSNIEGCFYKSILSKVQLVTKTNQSLLRLKRISFDITSLRRIGATILIHYVGKYVGFGIWLHSIFKMFNLMILSSIVSGQNSVCSKSKDAILPNCGFQKKNRI